MSGPPSFSATWKPGSSTSSNDNARNKPISFQRPIQQKAPSHEQVDPQAKKSDIKSDQDEEAAKPLSIGALTHAKFEDLAPPHSDSEDKVKSFLGIPPIERTFQILPITEVSGSRDTEPSMSGSQKSSSCFALQDIDHMLSEASSAKKEDTSSKPRAHFLRSKIPPSNKKRKESEAIGSEAFPVLLEFQEAMRHGQMSMEQMSRSYSEKISENEDLKKMAALRLKKADEDAARITKLEEENKKHESFLIELSKKHDREMDELVAEAKRSAGTVILEARIKMVEEAEAKGLDVSFWDMEAWRRAKAKLDDEDPFKEEKEQTTEKIEEDPAQDAGKDAIDSVAE